MNSLNYNPVLQNFIKMRQNLNASTSSSSKKELPRSLHQLPKPDNSMTIAMIIEHTPSDKDVKEYFKRRVEELVQEQEEEEAQKK